MASHAHPREIEGRPNCYACASFWVTYDPARPYGCRAFRMRSTILPSLAVREASGADCRAFTPKDEPKKEKRPPGLYG